MSSWTPETPDRWRVTTIGEATDTKLGRMLNAEARSGPHQVPYLRNENVRWGSFDLSDVSTMSIPPDRQADYELKPGDLLVCEGGEIGRAAVWSNAERPMYFQKALHRLRVGEDLLPRFVMYWLQYLARSGRLLPFATGSTILHLPQEALRQLPLVVPPLDEQRDVVENVERLLSRIQAGARDLEAATERNASLDLSLLHAACTGGLIATPDAADATDLLDEIGVSASARRAHDAQGWAWVPLGEVADTALGKMLSKEVRDGDNPVPYLRNENVQWGRIDTEDLKEMTLQPDELERYAVQAGDLLVCEGGEAGRCAIWRGGVEPIYYQKALHRVRPHPPLAVEWVALALEYVVRTGRHASLLTGTTIKHLPQEKLRELPIPVAPPDTQEAVLREVDRFRSLVSRLEGDVSASLRRTGALRRSVLQAAFSGRLAQTSGQRVQRAGDGAPSEELIEEVAS